ncbi:MAG: hypothetical protein HC886_06340 [Leptolyngbyaceae cyanobacterium SM1_1_3]|nr:hypothetical protein [Leptolyngbyaceae cyanobacterium SM1_1_3]NJN03515.1 hypothetical protein [Leptolyngbyaceae cyanobacterium RM1_1_2]NJO10268.1 hypothetical protein [Leptolyngbyaceae cyanobacterium SL_1_1]
MTELFPFDFQQIQTATIAGAALWALAFYLAFSPLADWVIEQLNRWFNFAERSLYTSQQEFERTRKGRESQNAFYASLFSIVPFILVGILAEIGTELSLGPSWGISLGMIACIGSGVYELGRRDGSA